MLEELLSAVLGIVVGVFTGLIPGIHVNTVVIILISFLPVLLGMVTPYSLVAFVISMAIVHSYVDYIPSIFLGAPAEDSVLSVLPGHKLLLKGRGYEAVRLTAIGGLGATVLGVVFLSAGIFALPVIYRAVSDLVPYILLWALVYIIFFQNRDRSLYALVAVLYSGALGLLILDFGLISLKYALFPALTGLFGISALIYSMHSRVKIPHQTFEKNDVDYKKGVLVGSLAGLLAGLLPSIGSSQSATVVQGFFKHSDEREFLVALGGVNTANTMYAFMALYLIEKTRSGASIAIKEIIDIPTFYDLLFMIGIMLFTTFFAVFITLRLARFVANTVQKADYKTFSESIIIFLAIMVFFLTGLTGFLILVTASAIGIFVQETGVNRSSCMAILIVPTVLYYLG